MPNGDGEAAPSSAAWPPAPLSRARSRDRITATDMVTDIRTLTPTRRTRTATLRPIPTRMRRPTPTPTLRRTTTRRSGPTTRVGACADTPGEPRLTAPADFGAVDSLGAGIFRHADCYQRAGRKTAEPQERLNPKNG